MPANFSTTPPFLVKKTWAHVVIPTAQVKTLFSIPVVLIPSIPGSIVLPTFFTLNKSAGTAYTNTGNTNVTLRWMSPVGPTLLATLRNLPVVNLFTVAAATFWTDRHGTTTGAGYTTADPVGSYIDLKLDTADFVVGDASLDINILCDVWSPTLGGF